MKSRSGSHLYRWSAEQVQPIVRREQREPLLLLQRWQPPGPPWLWRRSPPPPCAPLSPPPPQRSSTCSQTRTVHPICCCRPLLLLLAPLAEPVLAVPVSLVPLSAMASRRQAGRLCYCQRSTGAGARRVGSCWSRVREAKGLRDQVVSRCTLALRGSGMVLAERVGVRRHRLGWRLTQFAGGL